jgi:acyl-CoA synthetase (AMP-forming)/AMP-acid ligase II
MLARNVRNVGARTFIHSDEGDLTYAEFDRRACRFANVLAALGVAKGAPVGLFLHSRVVMAVGYWACQKLGALPVMMSAMYRETELRNAFGRTEMAIVVTHSDILEHVTRIRADFPGLKTVLVEGPDDGAHPNLPRLMAEASERFRDVQCLGSDIASMFFTSGTSGLPKGALQSQFAQWSAVRDMMTHHNSRFASEVYYCTAPLFGNLGTAVIMNLCMYTGGSMVMHERWDTRRVLDAIRTYRVTLFLGTPTMFVHLINAFDPARDDLSSLRLATQGGAPVSQVVSQRFEAIAGAPLLQAYGSTETLGQNVLEPVRGLRKPGSAGPAIGSSRVEIVDDAGNTLPPNAIGEVVVSGDCVGSGYWRDPEASARTFTPRGWMSGDLGYLDEDGYLFVVDRKKEVIISGGHNIYPLEIENLLYKHPAVAVCAALGVPDEVRGEIPVAVVALKDGAAATADELLAFCRENISAYKAAKRIYFVDEMPMGAGKIRKRELLGRINDGTLKAG